MKRTTKEKSEGSFLGKKQNKRDICIKQTWRANIVKKQEEIRNLGLLSNRPVPQTQHRKTRNKKQSALA